MGRAGDGGIAAERDVAALAVDAEIGDPQAAAAAPCTTAGGALRPRPWRHFLTGPIAVTGDRLEMQMGRHGPFGP
jgi:hypothetical protein